MAEQLDLTVAVPSKGGTSFWRVSALRLHWDEARIVINLVGENGETLSHQYDSTEATDLMVTLNKANLSTNSLHKRVLNKLVADGVIGGTISGSPD